MCYIYSNGQKCRLHHQNVREIFLKEKTKHLSLNTKKWLRYFSNKIIWQITAFAKQTKKKNMQRKKKNHSVHQCIFFQWFQN